MGSLLLKEAGGIVTDCYGKELDYKQGRRLEKNYGIIAASEKIIWEKAIEAVKRKE
jgi:3'(2'), 5'-bisphosphate nucleotidase